MHIFTLVILLVVGESFGKLPYFKRIHRYLPYCVVTAGPKHTPDTDNPDSCPANLCRAAAKRNEGKIRRAIKRGTPNICNCTCDPDPVPVTNKTLLHVTAIYECVAYANLMLDTPPNCPVDVLDAKKRTPLHDAAASCNPPMAHVRPSTASIPYAIPTVLLRSFWKPMPKLSSRTMTDTLQCVWPHPQMIQTALALSFIWSRMGQTSVRSATEHCHTIWQPTRLSKT